MAHKIQGLVCTSVFWVMVRYNFGIATKKQNKMSYSEGLIFSVSVFFNGQLR